MADYEAALRALQIRYVTRLGHSLQAIDNILAQRALGPLAKADVSRAHFLAHGLAGSGTIFGFPEVTAAASSADQLLSGMISDLPAGTTLDATQFAAIENSLQNLRAVCAAAVRQAQPLPSLFPAIPPVAKPDQRHIHVIDDDVELAARLAIELTRDQFTVTVSNDGESAMQAARRRMPDLVILDLSLPQMSGHEILRRLKQDPEFVMVPILILSGRGDQSDKVQALHSGALDYLTKPFDLSLLRQRVGAILQTADRELNSGQG